MIKVDLNVDLRKIPSLTFPELKEYYEALFNIPTTSTRKEYYVWRITNKLQEMRFGGLDNKTRRMLENMEIKELSEHKMVAGIELVKKYKGATYKVRVVNGGFMMDGETYKSLGAVARTITGRKISGQAFSEYSDGRNQVCGLYQKINGRRLRKRV